MALAVVMAFVGIAMFAIMVLVVAPQLHGHGLKPHEINPDEDLAARFKKAQKNSQDPR